MQNVLPSTTRKIVATAVAILFCLVLVAENLPDSETKTRLSFIQPATLVSGLGQQWGVFAPIPTSLEINTYAMVQMPDGTQIQWDPPTGNLLTGMNRAERWRKWSVAIRTEQQMHLWLTNAAHIASDIENDTGIEPVTVTLIRRWSEAKPPGQGFEREYAQYEFYMYDVATGTGSEPEDEAEADPQQEVTPEQLAFANDEKAPDAIEQPPSEVED